MDGQDCAWAGRQRAYDVFYANGTYLEADPKLGVDVRLWRATGERTADLTCVVPDIHPDPAATGPGMVTLRRSVAVYPLGTVFTATYPARGARLEVESMLSLGPHRWDPPTR